MPFMKRGIYVKSSISQSNTITQRGYIPGTLSPGDNGYDWKVASKADRLKVCRSLEQSIGGFSALWYYWAINAFYDTYDSSVLNTTIAQIGSLCYVTGRN